MRRRSEKLRRLRPRPKPKPKPSRLLLTRPPPRPSHQRAIRATAAASIRIHLTTTARVVKVTALTTPVRCRFAETTITGLMLTMTAPAVSRTEAVGNPKARKRGRGALCTHCRRVRGFAKTRRQEH